MPELAPCPDTWFRLQPRPRRVSALKDPSGIAANPYATRTITAGVMHSAYRRPGVIWKLFAPPPRAPGGGGGRLSGSHSRIDASSNATAAGAAGPAPR